MVYYESFYRKEKLGFWEKKERRERKWKEIRIDFFLFLFLI